ncbi:hypothetical protein [Actinomadura meridiana]|uniref:hypothetical protein n=1 Tax=Actinomadura meridiana TaxID=559626 RepID=UPI0031EE219A
MVKNVGTAPIDPQGTFDYIKVYDGDGDATETPTELGDFPECEDGELDKLAVGEHFTHCNLYTTGEGYGAAKVVFTEKVSVDGGDSREVAITWAMP